MNVPASSRLARYLTVILRWLAITFVVFVLTLLTGVSITNNLLPRVYTATARVQIRPPSSQGFDPINFQSEFETMESSDFLVPIIHDLGLDQAWAVRIFKSKEDQLSDQDALAYMHKILKLDFVRGTNVINITASSDVPEEAAQIANAIADRYKTLRDVEQDQRESQGEDALRDQIAQQQKVVDDAKAAVGKLPQDQSPALRDAQLQIERQQSLLDALNIRLQQVLADRQIMESSVQIISRTEIATAPDRHFALLVIIVAGGVLSVMAASFVEIILLFLRAGKRTGN
jgi:uncharacterized protein involved in exopolysaccharide biosynthesis